MPIVWVPSPFHSHAHAMAKQSHHIHYSCLHRDPCMVIWQGVRSGASNITGNNPRQGSYVYVVFFQICWYHIIAWIPPKTLTTVWYVGRHGLSMLLKLGEKTGLQHSCEISFYPIVISATCVLLSWSLYATNVKPHKAFQVKRQKGQNSVFLRFYIERRPHNPTFSAVTVQCPYLLCH